MSHLGKVAVYSEGGAEIVVTPEELEQMLVNAAQNGWVPSIQEDGELDFFAQIPARNIDEGKLLPKVYVGALAEAIGKVVTLKRGISTHVGVLTPTSWRVSYLIGDGRDKLERVNILFKDSQIISVDWDKEHDRLCAEVHPF